MPPSLREGDREAVEGADSLSLALLDSSLEEGAITARQEPRPVSGRGFCVIKAFIGFLCCSVFHHPIFTWVVIG